MKEKSFYKIQAVVISLILIFQVFIPILSMADNKESAIKVEKHREDNKVTLTITDTKAKIKNVRIVYGEKITNVDEFLNEDRTTIKTDKGQDLEFTATSGTENNYVYTTSFDIRENCNEYTIFILDESSNSFLYNYTITPSSASNMTMSVTKSETNPKELTITVTSAESEIKTLRIAKVSNKEEKVDFETKGTDIDIKQQTDKKNISLKYTVSEDGIYKVYAKDGNGSTYTYTVIVSSEKNPITIEYKQNETQKSQLEITVSDTVGEIKSVKIAKYEVNKEIDWEKAEEIFSNQSENKTANLKYEIKENGKYSIRVEDTAGQSFTRTTSRLYINDDDKPEIKISKSKDNEKVFNIVAEDNMSKVVEIYVSEDTELSTIDEIKTKATKIDITSGNKVEVSYELKTDAKTLYVYGISEDGQAFSLKAEIENIQEEQQPGTEQPGTEQPGTEQPGTEQPGTEQPGTEQPGTEQPGTEQPGTQQPETQQPETQQPTPEQPGIERPTPQQPEDNQIEVPTKPSDNQNDNNQSEIQTPNNSNPIEDNQDDYSYPSYDDDNETNSNYNQNYDEVEEYEDSTVSNNPLPQTGIKNGIVTVMMILMVNAVIALRKYSKIR